MAPKNFLIPEYTSAPSSARMKSDLAVALGGLGGGLLNGVLGRATMSPPYMLGCDCAECRARRPNVAGVGIFEQMMNARRSMLSDLRAILARQMANSPLTSRRPKRRPGYGLWQFKNGKTADISLNDVPLDALVAWDRGLGAAVFYEA